MDKSIKVSVITSLYRGEKHLNGFFDSFLKIKQLEMIELIIIHNDPTPDELIIINKYKSDIPCFKHLIVPREGLYSSWNRGIKASTGKYLAMWNVDDVRTSEGLHSQIDILDQNPNIAIVSGDYMKVFKYGNKTGYLKKDPVVKNIFLGAIRCKNGSCLMWRKAINEKIGYFDEQLKISGDSDFWLRVTRTENCGRCNELLGFYLRIEGEGLSKKSVKKDYSERNAIYLRYYRLKVLSNPLWFFQYYRSKKSNIEADKILSFGQYTYYPIRSDVISFVFTCLFFWTNRVKDFLVRIKYLFLYHARN